MQSSDIKLSQHGRKVLSLSLDVRALAQEISRAFDVHALHKDLRMQLRRGLTAEKLGSRTTNLRSNYILIYEIHYSDRE